MKVNKNQLVWGSIVVAFGLIAVGVGVTIGVEFWYFYPESSTRYTDIAQIGDFMGGVSAPFLAVSGSLLVFAAFLKQAADSEKNAENFIKQEFESTFLQMIQLLREIRKEVNAMHQSKENYFAYAVNTLKGTKRTKDALIRQLAIFHHEEGGKDEHYLAFVIYVLEYVEGFNKAESQSRETYGKAVKIQLFSLQFTRSELLYIHAYVCLKHPDKMAVFDGYGFFERLPEEERLIVCS